MTDRLAERYRVLPVDLRGHGRSSRPGGLFTLEDLAEDVARVQSHAGISSAAIVGLSQGAMTAMRLALSQPERVSALVIMNSSAEPEPFAHRVKYLAMAAAVRLGGVHPRIAHEVQSLMFSEGFRLTHPDVVQQYAHQWMQMDRASAFLASYAVATRGDLTSRLREIHAPTLVLAGTLDRATPLERSRRMAEQIPGAKLVILEGVGHLSTVERPIETAEQVSRFLASIHGFEHPLHADR
jgi:3-oxoadipate enol-lactonase